jgi:hypothetical protein
VDRRIIRCDCHPVFQQIAFVDTETRELQERRLQHPEEAEKFYRGLAAQGMKVRVGMEASGHARIQSRLNLLKVEGGENARADTVDAGSSGTLWLVVARKPSSQDLRSYGTWPTKLSPLGIPAVLCLHHVSQPPKSPQG